LKEIAGKVLKGELLTAAEWWYYMMENSDQFTEAKIQEYQNVGMPGEISSALDKLKFNGWNIKDRKNYEEEVQEVITYYGELERCEMKGHEEGRQEGLQEGIQKGLQEGEIRGLIKSLISGLIEYGSLPKKLLRQMEKHSLSEALVKSVWDGYVSEDEISEKKNLEYFTELLRKENVLEI
jgi:flagellar biosynthesis/type III secretory pathway protein FliH